MLFGLVFIGSMIYLVIRLSISCMFWISSKPNDKQHVLKVYFPYYIIALFGLCITAIVQFNNSLLATYFFSAIFFISLLIWRRDLKPNTKTNINNKFAVEPNHPNLP